MSKKTKYHRFSSCNKCGKTNNYEVTNSVEGRISECKTTCQSCGFEDYWAYGFFESSQDMESKCKTYSFNW